MASYTIEDIELIRRKSGISYQEAVALLDYHNGNVARALVDLERNGRIKTDGANKESTASAKARRQDNSFFSRMYRFRLKVKKGEIVIANVSMLFALLALLVSPHLVVIAAIAVLALGYSVSFDRKDKDFASANLEKMVRNAADNVKSSVNDFARSFDETNPAGKEAPVSQAPEAAPQPAQEQRSYYQANPAATRPQAAYTGKAPILQVPVQVETQDGQVRVEDDGDGFSSATIE